LHDDGGSAVVVLPEAGDVRLPTAHLSGEVVAVVQRDAQPEGIFIEGVWSVVSLSSL
jgi:hypothetical protein